MHRTKTGGLINRKKVLNFSFNGKNLNGFDVIFDTGYNLFSEYKDYEIN